jgi:hypothetical protein
MLNPSDVYVSGGSNNLLACWTDKVTKYDASSFYNWEQDNLPLHDLDERTHLLWEKFGHPTSALTGMSFIVSADATSSCNPLYFTTLSSCIDALPEVINYPILIEVASFGNLGGLNLSNKSFGPNGALEIINRNFAYQSPNSNNNSDFGNNSEYVDTDSNYGLLSSLTAGGQPRVASLISTTFSSFPIISFDLMRSRLFTKDENNNDIFVASGSEGLRYADSRFVNPYVFAQRAGRDFGRLTAALSSTVAPWTTSPTEASSLSKLDFEAFDKTPTTEMATYDVSTLDFINNSEIQWGSDATGINANTTVAAVAYFNHLEYIKVKNCDGPIYLRNFNVDSKHSRDNGVEILNSNINLERLSVSRANKAGLYCSDSNVNVLKGLVAYRNYELNGSVRTGIPFSEKRNSYSKLAGYGAGVYCLNSTLNFKDTYDRDNANYLALSSTDGAASDDYGEYFRLTTLYLQPSTTTLPSVGNENLYSFSRNDIGIHAINSNILGGRKENSSAPAPTNSCYQIFSELNTEAGVKLENSVMSNSGRLILNGNYIGLDCDNSKVETDSLTCRYNQSVGVNLENSKLVYNKDAYALYTQISKDHVETLQTSQLACIRNGQDIKCNNSIISPVYVNSMPSTYSMVFTSGSFGREEHTDKLLPSIHLKNNSDADLVHARLLKSPAGVTTTSQYGLLAKVENNSTLCARGSREYANMMVGPLARADNVNVVGLFANNGSTIKLQGPTSMFRLGIDVLAENNSNIEITPHQSSNGELLVSSFDLSSAENHTMVELHSTRACLVANRNSNILMENLGDYFDKWLSSPYASATVASPGYRFLDGNYTQYASGGYLQFYPNANLVDLDADSAAANNAAITGTAAYQFNAPGAGSMTADYIHNASPVSSVTTGGMCVRAVENSLVKATNVHFPQAGFPDASSVAYDYYGTDPLPGPHCSRLFIWNIADNSILESSYISVSGTHPRNSGFHGPSGVWGNLSGAPSSTPDTSSLSILDYYGHSTENPYGKSASGENYGCFRLFFSTDPACNFLVASGTNRLEGLARQVFAQGYNFSGNLIASATDEFIPSTQYTSLFQRDIDGNINASGFYYASAMMAGAGSIKAFLDDSALNTFANAKHNTVGKSGLAKVVQGYYDINNVGGDSYNIYPYGQGMASINNFDLKKDN